MHRAIRQKNVFLLWLGQLTSSIGDEVYRVAFVWMSVGFIGADTGFLVGAQVFVIMLVTLFGGRWTDRWNHYQTMIWADLLRAFLILVPVGISLFYNLSYPILWITSVLIAALGGVFDPSLDSVVPEQSKNERILRGANGLMSTTKRTARLVAPMIIAALTALIPTLHFFTLDSLTFIFSAFTIYILYKRPKPNPDAVAIAPVEKLSFKKVALAPINTLKKHPDVERAFYLKALMAGAWWVCFSLGLALLVRQKFSSNLTAFGFVLSAYGLGNLLGAVVCGIRERKKLELEIYSGFILLGVGFIAVALAPNIYWMAFAAVITAFSGPMNDLPYIDLVQSRYKQRDYTRIARFRLSAETGCAFIGFLIAPSMFRIYGPERVITVCGVWMVLLGLYGIKKARMHSSTRALI